ncbi:MAG: methylated-DNA--[protein]-cysteine S-methyltransferase [Candidatus Aegiribacteria sp.]|nr:methylated-DNA--[protein]-cysteine S-methyltransferase [Candidatus Aegiribacteria sp.]
MKNDDPGRFYLYTHSPIFGSAALLWSMFRDEPLIFRILLSGQDVTAEAYVSEFFHDCSPGTCCMIDSIAGDIEAFLNGEDISFSLSLVRMDLCSEFQKKVLVTEHSVPRGHVSTYQQIAERLGCPGSSRAVGNALSRNRFPIIIPCHRTIRSDGTPGGYQGGSDMKRRLLSMEGILFDERNRVRTIL